MMHGSRERDYFTIEELMARTGLSRATLWRLKRAGKIPVFQPGGKGASVLFPSNAIEQVVKQLPVDPNDTRLSGRRPVWMQTHPPNP